MSEIDGFYRMNIGEAVDGINSFLEESRSPYRVFTEETPRLRVCKQREGERHPIGVYYPLDLSAMKTFVEGMVCALEELGL